jgi:hypothetical protein
LQHLVSPHDLRLTPWHKSVHTLVARPFQIYLVLSCYLEMLMQVAALLPSQVSSFAVGVGGAHARYKAKPLREPAAHAPAFSEAEKQLAPRSVFI